MQHLFLTLILLLVPHYYLIGQDHDSIKPTIKSIKITTYSVKSHNDSIVKVQGSYDNESCYKYDVYAEFNIKGKKTLSKKMDTSGIVFRVEHFEYDKENNNIERIDSTFRENDTLVSHTKFKFTKKENLVYSITHCTNCQPPIEVWNSYDNHNNIIKSIRIGDTATTRYSYSTDGTIIKSIRKLSRDGISLIQEMDSSGKLLKKYLLYKNKNIKDLNIYKFGPFTDTTLFYKDGINLSSVIYTDYDSIGRILSSRHYNYSKYHQKRDTTGKVVSTENLFTTEPVDSSIIKYEYNLEGNVSYKQVSSINCNNQITTDKYYYKYDNKSNLIELRCVAQPGAKGLSVGDDINEGDDFFSEGEYLLLYEYDKNNFWTKRLKYKNGNPIFMVEREIIYY